MSPLRNLVTIAASAAAISYAGASRADVTSTTVTQQQPQPQQPVVVQQPPPPQTVTVQPAPAPQSTTTTTAAPFTPTQPGTEYGERSVEHRPNKTLLTTGIGIFVVSYAASGIAGLASTKDSDGFLLVPLVGPWLDLGNRNCPCGGREDTNRAAIVTAGVFQTAGALLTLGSFFIPESTSVTNEKHVVTTKPEVHVTPVSYGNGAGIGAIGRF